MFETSIKDNPTGSSSWYIEEELNQEKMEIKEI